MSRSLLDNLYPEDFAPAAEAVFKRDPGDFFLMIGESLITGDWSNLRRLVEDETIKQQRVRRDEDAEAQWEASQARYAS